MKTEILNKRLIGFIEAHGVRAFANVYGSVTMIEEFFHTDYVEYHNVTGFAEARRHLGY